jgi:phosphatidylglycerophosphatase A
MTEAPAERPNPSLLSPPILLATWFGSGLLPGMPGTWGSLAALPFAWAINLYWGPAALFGAALAVFAVGVWASDVYARAAGTQDPGAVVIDEVAGQWLTLALAAPLDPLYYALGFLFFRLADIVKPWPVNWAERRFAGGLGIMLDDIFAAFYAAVALVALGYALGRF